MNTDNKSENISLDRLVENLSDHIETRFDYTRLWMVEKIAVAASQTVPYIAVLICISIFLLFGSITLALLLGKYCNDNLTGFAIVSGLYFLLAVVFYLARNSWKNKLADKMVASFFDDEND